MWTPVNFQPLPSVEKRQLSRNHSFLHTQHKVPQKMILWICLCFHQKQFFWLKFSQLTHFLSHSFPKPIHSTAAQSFVAKLQREQSGQENDGSTTEQDCHRPISHMASSDKPLAVAGYWNAWIWVIKSPLFTHNLVIRSGKKPATQGQTRVAALGSHCSLTVANLYNLCAFPQQHTSWNTQWSTKKWSIFSYKTSSNIY